MFKVLVVEDDNKINDIILQNIIKVGYEAKGIEDFNNVFNEFVNYEPDLVLLDINLPFYDGFYWCGKIRLVSKVPIMFISSRNTDMDIIIATNMGGDDFVVKPFSIELLMTKINALLRRTYSYKDLKADVIEHRGVVLNLKDDTLIYKEEKLELTKNEFKIMYILIKNHGNIISRDRIMRSLWKSESFVDDNTLTVNITRLRKKLKDIGINDFIETKKNLGYIIE
ncbi:response regulator transcription factor [Clostridium hydrogenum]|uniref:response regulator transcription factor n=1 Tax=Clostridium hydrogenum TaxID=2855764 RepID=UPI001F3842AE|nr:response regulator transcription factor [Clostridium hydrogenum]